VDCSRTAVKNFRKVPNRFIVSDYTSPRLGNRVCKISYWSVIPSAEACIRAAGDMIARSIRSAHLSLFSGGGPLRISITHPNRDAERRNGSRRAELPGLTPPRSWWEYSHTRAAFGIPPGIIEGSKRVPTRWLVFLVLCPAGATPPVAAGKTAFAGGLFPRFTAKFTPEMMCGGPKIKYPWLQPRGNVLRVVVPLVFSG